MGMSKPQNYYDAENERWPQLCEARCAPGEAEIAVLRLWRELVRLPHPPAVHWTRGRRRNHYSPGHHWVTLNHQGLVWLTVAHELAHAWDGQKRNMSARDQSKRRWHGRHHADYVDRACQWLLDQGALQGAFATAAAVKRAAEEARQLLAQEKVLAKRAATTSTEARIERRRAQVERLERKIKALTTRLKTAKRSLGALERALAKRQAQPRKETPQ